MRIQYMVVGFLAKILPVAVIGIGIFLLGNTIQNPKTARETAAAIGETGSAFGTSLSSVGTGIGDFLSGIGSGGSKLLDPLFSLKTLIYGDAASQSDNQVNQIANASNYTIDIPTPNTASSSPAVSPESAPETRQSVIRFPSGAPTTYPLSQAAIDYYRNIGVDIS